MMRAFHLKSDQNRTHILAINAADLKLILALVPCGWLDIPVPGPGRKFLIKKQPPFLGRIFKIRSVAVPGHSHVRRASAFHNSQAVG
jgi:hypothetical protein